MIKIILIVLVALLPTLLGFWFVLNSKRRFRARMRQIRNQNYYQVSLSQLPLSSGGITEEYHRYIGDLSCRYNADSPYLRCAVNPSGPCKDCPYYESKQTNK